MMKGGRDDRDGIIIFSSWSLGCIPLFNNVSRKIYFDYFIVLSYLGDIAIG